MSDFKFGKYVLFFNQVIGYNDHS